jgi:hypothetical protein
VITVLMLNGRESRVHLRHPHVVLEMMMRRKVRCRLIFVCQLTLCMIKTWNGQSILSVVIFNDLNIRVAILVGRSNGRYRGYLLSLLAIDCSFHI